MCSSSEIFYLATKDDNQTSEASLHGEGKIPKLTHCVNFKDLLLSDLIQSENRSGKAE